MGKKRAVMNNLSKITGINVQDLKKIGMENKDKYCRKDFEKIHKLKSSGLYEQSLKELHRSCGTSTLKVGIGIPEKSETIEKALKKCGMVDFIVVVDENGGCKVLYGDL